MLKYKPSDFNKKAQFGTIESGYNPKNGNPIKQFVPQIGLKYAPRTRTMTPQSKSAVTTL